MGLPKERPADITGLLRLYREGDPKAFEALIPLVYDHLKVIARSQMRSQPAHHTLSPTALVHETFLKLRDSNGVLANDRGHFYAIAARSMRWLLTDYARAKASEKRGGEAAGRVAFDDGVHAPRPAGIDVVLLEELLRNLERQDPRLCRVVELHRLVGLSIEETAEALSVSKTTVKRDWALAKAWLSKAIAEKE